MEDLPNQESVDLVPQQNPEPGERAHAGDTDSGRRLGLGMKRWGIVNAALCGLLVVAIVIALLLLVIPVIPFLGADAGLLGWIMIVGFIPLACIPIGISCLVGALRARAVLRRHPSQEARLGLRLSVGGPVAVLACYVLGFAILLFEVFAG